jgi:hypothetical protein
MKTWPLALVCLVTAGCRTDPAVMLLERENRQLEDRVYQLQDGLARAQAELQRMQGAGAPGGVPTESNGPALVPPQQQVAPGQTYPGAPVRTVPPLLQPPAVELPPLDGRPNEVPSTLRAPRSQPPAPFPGPRNGAEPRPPVAPNAPADSSGVRTVAPLLSRSTTGMGVEAATAVRVPGAQVQRVTLNERLTGGYDAGGYPGHDGVMVLLEPRDLRGRVVRSAGAVSVVVLDRSAAGDAARIGRWDFSAEQVDALWQRTSGAEGILLQMPWPGPRPPHGTLALFIRFVTDDGRRLEASRDIEVRLAGPNPGGWAPSTAQLTPLPPPDHLHPSGQWRLSQETPPSELDDAPPFTAAAPPQESPPPPAQDREETALARPVWSPNRR